MAWQGLIARYGARLEISHSVEPVSLCEGNTPLIPAPHLSKLINADVHLKYEGLNPTGSFKDRGMTTAITQARAEGAKSVICASTGNTAASAAAYAARAGMKCIVLIPDGKIALGKLAGAIAYGAQVIAINGSFDDGLRMVREVTKEAPIALVNSVNPARLEGQKTAAWEVTEQLGQVPDWLCLPVGNAGNISAYWLGFTSITPAPPTSLPRLLGAQAAGAAPIVRGHVIENPETFATAIRIGNPARWIQAEDAARDSKGTILAVSDGEIFKAYQLLSQKEGVFCEPSSAAGVAGLLKEADDRPDDFAGKKIVCVLTGHGLKDPDSAVGQAKTPIVINASVAELLKHI